MFSKNLFRVSVILVTAFSWSTPSVAEEGQGDLDKAIELQLSAESPQDLDQVISYCESALKKGLDEDNAEFAGQLLSSTAYRYGSMLAQFMTRQQPQLREQTIKMSLGLLEKAIKYNPELADAHLLRAELMLRSGGDREDAAESIELAIDLFAATEEGSKQAKAHLMRAGLQEDRDKQFDAINQAIKADPDHIEARQMRSQFFIARQEFDNAIGDIKHILSVDPTNLDAMRTLAAAHVGQGDVESALVQIDKMIEIRPESPLPYRIRAGVHVTENRIDEAIEDLTSAYELDPRDVGTLLMRCQVYHENQQLEKAKQDIEKVLRIQPGLVQGIWRRSMISADQGELTSAIADLLLLSQNDPGNAMLRMELARLYDRDERPRKAIAEYTKVLEDDESNWLARSMRGTTYISIGAHEEAIADYGKGLEQQPDNEHMLNNLAWILATSPKDELRDGKRALEYGEHACKVTEFKKAYILSTYAAGFAEVGDFENAIKWSSEAVKRGSEEIEQTPDDVEKARLTEQVEQLKTELDSYQEGKPWREKQEVKEKADPLQPGRGRFAT